MLVFQYLTYILNSTNCHPQLKTSSNSLPEHSPLISQGTTGSTSSISHHLLPPLGGFHQHQHFGEVSETLRRRRRPACNNFTHRFIFLFLIKPVTLTGAGDPGSGAKTHILY